MLRDFIIIRKSHIEMERESLCCDDDSFLSLLAFSFVCLSLSLRCVLVCDFEFGLHPPQLA